MENKNIAIKRNERDTEPSQAIVSLYCCCCCSVVALPFLWSNQYLANKVQYFRVEISILNSYTLCTAVFRSLWAIREFLFLSFLRGRCFLSVRCLLPIFNGFIVVCVSVRVLQMSLLRLFCERALLGTDFSFDLIVFTNLCTLQEEAEEKRKSLCNFSLMHTQYFNTFLLYPSYTCAIFCTVITSTIFFHFVVVVVAIKH